MKKLIILLLPFYTLAQSSLVNVSNYCGTPVIQPNGNGHKFARTDNYLIYKSTSNCLATSNSGVFDLWAYDGINPPYKLKYPDGSDVDNIGGNREIINLNNKIYLNKQLGAIGQPNSNELWYFDENVSSAHITKINTDNFDSACKDFTNFVRFQNGFIYSGSGYSNCFFDGLTNPTYRFYDYRYSNFSSSGSYFSNIEYMNNLIYKTDQMNVLKKYDPISNQTSVILNGVFKLVELTKFNNKLFFINKSITYGTEIFYYDNNSINCLDMSTGTSSSNPSLLTVYNNNLYFYCTYNGFHYIYKYDGVNNPIIIHQKPTCSVQNSSFCYYTGMTVNNGKLYFANLSSQSGINETELYSYSENDSSAILDNTFIGFTTDVPANDYMSNDTPQFSAEQRGSLFSFKNELYIIGMQFYNPNLFSADQDIWKIEPSNLSISDNILNNNLILYPNPTNDYLSVKFDENIENTKIEIYNSLGQIVTKSEYINTDFIKVNLPEIKQTYFLKIIQNNSKHNTYKIIKK